MTESTWLPRDEWLKTLEARPASANVLLENSQHELLIIKPTYRNIWGLPGGVIDAGETPLAAAIREVKEEVDVVVAPEELRFTAASLRQHGAKQPTYQFTYHATIDDERFAAIALQASEIGSYRFIGKDDVLRTAANTTFTAAILHWASDQPGGYLEVAIAKDDTEVERETMKQFIPFQ